jgi:LysM repeat protein
MRRNQTSSPFLNRQSAWLLAVACLLAPAPLAVAQNQVPETHTVRPGDTLWGLARQYLGDPFLWPDIYRINTLVVEDPHWIYPGEVLKLTGGEATSAVPVEAPAPGQAVAPAAAPSPGQIADATPAVEATPAVAADTDTTAAAGQVPEEPAQVADTEAVPDTLTEAAPAEAAAEPTPSEGLFPRAITLNTTQPLLIVSRAYRPLRRSEFYSSGFLTEGQKLPWGRLLGPVTPSQISSSTPGTAHLFTKIAVAPPKGASYQVGDTLLLVRIDRATKDFGDVVVPTGMARVLDVSHGQTEAEVINEYGAIRNGQSTLPAERFRNGGSSRAVPISDGVQGAVIEVRDPETLVQPQDVLFINRGRKDGVAAGDIFEVRRTPSQQEDAPNTVPEVMAVLQIVHVRERSATARVLAISSPRIEPGTVVRQVAKLPT